MHSMGKLLFTTVMLLLLILPFSFPASAEGLLSVRTLDRDFDPIIVTGESMPGFSGTQLDQLFVYAYLNSQWQQIPWQFDEVKDGIYLAADNGQLDAEDELVAMGLDCGDQAASNEWISDASAQSDLRYEIMVLDPLNPAKRCWIYVYRSGDLTEAITEDYVDYDYDTSIFTTPVYKLGFFLEYLAGSSLELNGSGIDVLDRSKLRFEDQAGGVFTEEFMESEDPRPVILDGRVRAMAGYQGDLAGFALRMLTIAYRSQFYDRELFDISWTGGHLEWARLSADFNENLVNGIYYDANTPSGVAVDGIPDAVPTTPVSLWQQVSAATGTVFHAGDASAMQGVESVYYKDDAMVDPTDTGDQKSYGDMGMTVTGPFTLIDMEVTHYILPPNQPNMGAIYYDYYTHPLETQATEQQFSTASSYSLSVSVSGSGTVSSDPSGIECGSLCTANFLDGTEVSLAASHDPSWTLGSWIWTGACAGSDACNIVMDTDKVANVHFYCELITIPLQTVDSSAPVWECFDLEAVSGFAVIGPDGDVIFSAENSIELGPEFRIGSGARFQALISP